MICSIIGDIDGQWYLLNGRSLSEHRKRNLTLVERQGEIAALLMRMGALFRPTTRWAKEAPYTHLTEELISLGRVAIVASGSQGVSKLVLLNQLKSMDVSSVARGVILGEVAGSDTAISANSMA